MMASGPTLELVRIAPITWKLFMHEPLELTRVRICSSTSNPAIVRTCSISPSNCPERPHGQSRCGACGLSQFPTSRVHDRGSDGGSYRRPCSSDDSISNKFAGRVGRKEIGRSQYNH